MMSTAAPSLMSVYEGWDGYQLALVRTVTPLLPEQLAWRAAPHLRSTGELIAHIVTGRIGWIHTNMGVESPVVTEWIAEWRDTSKQSRFVGGALKEGTEHNTKALGSGLEATWKMIEGILTGWTTDDLRRTFLHPYWGKTYVVPYQWVLWRIMCHDIHHGGELSIMLGLQGIPVPDLGDQGGHLTEVIEANQPPVE